MPNMDLNIKIRKYFSCDLFYTASISFKHDKRRWKQ